MPSAQFILALFLLAQACDGSFTYVVVQAHGFLAEGNPLLITWMGLVGPAPALVGAKILASGCGVLLYMCGMHRPLAWITALYGIAAIGPWVFILRQF